MNAVTGAFGYTGQYIARLLLARGEPVITLTGNRARSLDIPAFPLCFDDVSALARSLHGTRALYNTYWVRFDRGPVSHARAVEQSRALIAAAQKAGVRRIVHISISNPSPDSRLPYFRGKALVEQAIRESGLSYAILRPTVIFGREDIFINNIAHLLRRYPVFAVPGDGQYRLQPVAASDLAELAVAAGDAAANIIEDAAGPETFAFDELVRLIARSIGSRARIVHTPPALALAASRILGWALHDVILTRDEIHGLMQGLLVSSEPPLGRTRFSEWLASNHSTLGLTYASELRRHFTAS